MKLCVLGSGSKGNAILMQSGTTRLLIDAGFGTRTISKRLQSIGVDPRSIHAVLVTHEHTDHARGAVAAANRWGWQIFATAGTKGASLELSEFGATTLVANECLKVGDAEILPVAISHDATEPIAVIATDVTNGVRAAIVYDLGRGRARPIVSDHQLEIAMPLVRVPPEHLLELLRLIESGDDDRDAHDTKLCQPLLRRDAFLTAPRARG